MSGPHLLEGATAPRDLGPSDELNRLAEQLLVRQEKLAGNNQQLQRRVRAGTTELTRINGLLKREIAHRELTQEALAERCRFEQLLADLSARFVDIPAADVDGAIENGLCELQGLLGADRAGLGHFSEDGSEMRITHTCALPGIDCPPGVVLHDELPFLTGKLRKGEIFRFTSLADLSEEEAREREFFAASGIKSHQTIPFRVAGSPQSVLGFSCFRESSWSDELVPRLRLLGGIFANALAHKRKELEIERLKVKLRRENIQLRQEIQLHYSHDEIVGRSPMIKEVLKHVEQVAGTESTVLIQGETGTGKELMARAVHRLSSRRERPMVKVNCAALPATLIDSELFGREKGAYTGALTKQLGRFELADGTTIFLDEVGELPLDLQSKLLRVLQEGQFERLGSSKTIQVDVRIIAATNRNLAAAVREGRFRQDLYYRLNVIPIEVPPLRERVEDIPPLAWAFIQEFGEKMGKRIDTIPRTSMEALQRHPWPGNVRELRNVIEHAMIVSRTKKLQVEVPGGEGLDTATTLDLMEVERAHILKVLTRTRWRIKGKGGAAALLGLKPTTLHSRLNRLGIHRPGTEDERTS